MSSFGAAMEPVGWQLILRAEDDRVLAPSQPSRRAAVRVVLRVADPAGLLVFGFADTHVHIVLLCDRAVAGETARRLEIALGRRLGLRFAPARIRAVRNAWHLDSLFHYTLRQAAHHGVQADPRRESSAVHDLVGLRVLPQRMIERAREHLPRLGSVEVRAHLPVPLLERVDLSLIAPAAAAAFALPDLAGSGRDVVAARRAAVHAASAVAGVAALAGALGVDARTVRRILHREPPATHIRAVRLQMGLRSQVGDAVVEPASAQLPPSGPHSAREHLTGPAPLG